MCNTCRFERLTFEAKQNIVSQYQNNHFTAYELSIIHAVNLNTIEKIIEDNIL